MIVRNQDGVKGQLQDTFHLTGSEFAQPLNLCRFVAVLDKHDGKHQDPNSALMALTEFKGNLVF